MTVTMKPIYDRRVSIMKFCRSCSNDDIDARRWCPETECPLYPYRCGQEVKTSKARHKRTGAIERYCLSSCGECINGSCLNECPLQPWLKASTLAKGVHKK